MPRPPHSSSQVTTFGEKDYTLINQLKITILSQVTPYDLIET